MIITLFKFSDLFRKSVLAKEKMRLFHVSSSKQDALLF